MHHFTCSFQTTSSGTYIHIRLLATFVFVIKSYKLSKLSHKAKFKMPAHLIYSAAGILLYFNKLVSLIFAELKKYLITTYTAYGAK